MWVTHSARSPKLHAFNSLRWAKATAEKARQYVGKDLLPSEHGQSQAIDPDLALPASLVGQVEAPWTTVSR